MHEPQRLPSLLDILAFSGAPLRLNLTWPPEERSSGGDSRTPFFLVTDSDPLTGLYRGAFETEAGSLICPVFLLKQKDRYRQTASPLGRLTNTDVEGFWHNAAEQLPKSSSELSPIFLSGQRDSQGRLVPFRPLFFCRSRRVYFHPPCPRCGHELTLCRDDAWLVSHRLQGYSSSLSRYLYCPQCRQNDEPPEFFTYEAEPFDPPEVKDRHALVRDWSRRAAGNPPLSGLPCADCVQVGMCTDGGGRIDTELIPFGYYPFHLLLFETMSFHAPDFLCLASGGSLEELQARLARTGEIGKLNHLRVESRTWSASAEPFFFRSSPRFFLEVLYLKLAFLAEVARVAVIECGGPGLVDLAGSLDRIWVRLSGQNPSLPHFWTFRVRFLDIFRGAPGVPPQMKLPPTYPLHLMGVLWLTGLLSNKTQDGSIIQQTLDSLYNDQVQTPAHTDARTPPTYVDHPVFSPGNIFWNPETQDLPEPWRPLWHESLELGWSLIRAAYRMGADWSPERFQQQLSALLQRVKAQLFFTPEATEPIATPEDAVLAGILARILTQWEAEEPPSPQFRTPPSRPLEGRAPSISELETLPLDLTREIGADGGPETVILQPSPGAEPQPVETAHPQAQGDEAAETAIPPLRDGYASEETIAVKRKGTETEEAEVIPETVVLAPATPKGFPSPPKPPPAQEAVPESGGRPVDEEAGGDEQRRPRAEDEELLMETVILNPKKDKDT